MKKKGFSLAKLFNNDRFVLIFSVFAAIILWFVMATFNTEERPKVIEVPITVRLSEEAQNQGYQVFDQSDKIAKVSVKGNSLVVNQLSKDDIVVETITIGQKANFSVSLSAKKQGSLNDYEIVSVEPGSVIVNVDKKKTQVFDIQNNVKYNGKVDEKYHIGSPQLSAQTVTVSGPESEVSKIASASIEQEVKDNLTSTAQFTKTVVFRDANGNEISKDTLTQRHITIETTDTVDVTIPVLYKINVPIHVMYTNQPTQLDVSKIVTIDPQNIDIAAPTEQIGKSGVEVAPIDFANVIPDASGKASFALSIELPEGCTNLSEVYTVNVAFNLSNFTTKKINVDDLRIKNAANGKNVTATTKNLSVTVVGPKDLVENLTSAQIYGEIDMTGKEDFTGSTEMPVKISISSEFSSWAYGTYKANVNVS